MTDDAIRPFDIAVVAPGIAVLLAVVAVWLTVRFIRDLRRGPALAPGIVAVAVGLPFTVAPPPYAFGWFAYAPLTTQTFAPLNMWAVAGVILLAGGAFALGLALGSRLRTRP